MNPNPRYPRWKRGGGEKVWKTTRLSERLGLTGGFMGGGFEAYRAYSFTLFSSFPSNLLIKILRLVSLSHALRGWVESRRYVIGWFLIFLAFFFFISFFNWLFLYFWKLFVLIFWKCLLFLIKYVIMVFFIWYWYVLGDLFLFVFWVKYYFIALNKIFILIY